MVMLTVWCWCSTFKPGLSMVKRLVVPNIIGSVFPCIKWRMSSFSLNHSPNKFKLSDKYDSIISMLLRDTYNTVSSAYLIMREFLRTSTILFAKIINNKGSKMDPCGTHHYHKSVGQIWTRRYCNWLTVCD